MKQFTVDTFDVDAITRAYLSTPHTPNHPSYTAFANETLAQWRALVAKGWTFARSAENVYVTSDDMFCHARVRLLYVYTGGQNLTVDHPLARTISHHDGHTWTLNEVFRAVHDVNGHVATRARFETLQGELDAYQNHARMYSREALPALFGETCGQLAHYHSGRGFVALQECKVLPAEFYT